MVKGKTKGPRPKHIPLRTCVACHQERAKRELVRVVRTQEMTVRVDPSGKMAGRGAYLCRNRACWEQALTSQKLGAALKTTLTPADVAALQAFSATLPEPSVNQA